MTATVIPGEGVRITHYQDDFGFNVLLPETMTLGAIEQYLQTLGLL